MYIYIEKYIKMFVRVSLPSVLTSLPIITISNLLSIWNNVWRGIVPLWRVHSKNRGHYWDKWRFRFFTFFFILYFTILHATLDFSFEIHRTVFFFIY